MRFFLIGHQIDPIYFLDTLESLEQLVKLFSEGESTDLLLLAKVINLVQLCMAIHTGHPEKYKTTSELIIELTSTMKELVVDNEL